MTHRTTSTTADTTTMARPLDSGEVRRTIGLDLGDRKSDFCILEEGAPVVHGTVSTTREDLTEFLEKWSSSLVAMEVSPHSPWVSRLATELGHRELVADARRTGALAKIGRKSDRSDAELIARMAHADPALLNRVTHRSAQAQADLAVLQARTSLVAMRTKLVNHVRGSVKSVGGRVARCDARYFHKKAVESLPEELKPALMPILETIEQVSQQICEYDKEIERLGKESYPETVVLRQVSGVGPILSLMVVLVLGDPKRFRKSRDVGPYVGLVPRVAQSGSIDPQLGISKTGDRELRRLLVVIANYILGRGPDCDLKRWGQAIAARGGKNARKRAKVAVARKLVVLLHRLWITGEQYDPFRQARRRGEDVPEQEAAA